MKAYLIHTKEYSEQSVNEVCDLLASFKGPIQFLPPLSEFREMKFQMEIVSEPTLKYDKGRKTFESDEKIMTWAELFSICKRYRMNYNINKDDFVILLTTIKNEFNWFSRADKNRNAFVHTDNWDLYTKAPYKYPIAYQVMENIIQSLMNLDSDTHPNPNVHLEAIGCMNDFCQNKEQIILKLRTADICGSCLEKLTEENVSEKIINQALESFEGIRTQLLFRQGQKKQIKPVPIILNDRKQLLLPDLGNLEIELNPLFKTLYLFYLRHQEGVKLNELSDFKEELLKIYKRLSVSDDNATIAHRIDDLVNPIGESFNQKKTKINKIVNDLLGEPLAKFYRIEGKRGEPFKINLPEDLVDIRY